jgi:hypothetical protein
MTNPIERLFLPGVTSTLFKRLTDAEHDMYYTDPHSPEAKQVCANFQHYARWLEWENEDAFNRWFDTI